MRALLLAGGLGSRLRPLTDTLPKCLVPIGRQAVLDRWFGLLFRAGVERALVNMFHLPDAVRAHVANSRWADRIDLVHEAELLGTGGTVLANRGYFGTGSFLVIHADNVSDCDIAALVAAHERRPPGCCMTMLAFRTDRPETCGILEIDARGVLRAFHEKVPNPPGDLANAAVYVFAPEVVAAIAALGRPVVDLSTEVIPGLIGRIQVVRHDGYHRDIGTPESLARAREDAAQGRIGALAPVGGHC